MSTTSELEKYKKAMDQALQQLDWCIGYFQGTDRRDIARVLSESRQYIAQNIAGEDQPDMPTQADEAAEE